MATVTVPTQKVLDYIKKYELTWRLTAGNLTDKQKQSETLQVLIRSGLDGDTVHIMVRAHDNDPASVLDTFSLIKRDESSGNQQEDEVAALAERMAFLLGA